MQASVSISSMMMLMSHTAWCGASLHLLLRRRMDQCHTLGIGSMSAISSKTPGGRSIHRCSSSGHCHRAYLGRIGLILLRGLLTDNEGLGLHAEKSSVLLDVEGEGVDVRNEVSAWTAMAFSGLDTIKRASCRVIAFSVYEGAKDLLVEFSTGALSATSIAFESMLQLLKLLSEASVSTSAIAHSPAFNIVLTASVRR